MHRVCPSRYLVVLVLKSKDGIQGEEDTLGHKQLRSTKYKKPMPSDTTFANGSEIPYNFEISKIHDFYLVGIHTNVVHEADVNCSAQTLHNWQIWKILFSMS